MIYSFGITITIFLILLLSFKRNKTGADKILWLWFLFALIHQALTYFDASGICVTSFPFLIGVNLPLPLIHPPFLFLYTAALTETSPKNKALNLLHFLPVVIFYIYLINFFKLPVAQKIFVMSHNGAGFETGVLLKFIAIIASGFIYVILSLHKINEYQKRIRTIYSNTEKINLQWLKMLTYGIGLIWIVVILGNEIQTSIVISLFTLVIGFFGIRQVPIFASGLNTRETISVLTDELEADPIKYENSGLTEDKKQTLALGLKQFIDEKKMFLNPDLSLDNLASAISVHPNYVSQYINEHLGFTFYDYINSKRIEEFKEQLSLPGSKNLSLLGIAFNCGFNSKSSFNRNFKKMTGQTPTEYLKSVKNLVPSN